MKNTLAHLAFANLSSLARGLAAGEFSSVELAQLYLERIGRLNTKAHAYVAVYAESALLQAQAADLQRRAGLPLHPLHGLPIAVKDLCEIEGHITTGGSLTWKDRRSQVTSAVVERLQAAGMVILGKVHTAEFAFSGWGINPPMGTPRNPWDWREHHRAPGGSSSGSAVAVAAGLAPIAIGSDTGGSVRIPASFNGLTGLKTSYGLISCYGTIPLSASLDSIGPLARTAEDAALLTNALVGYDARDPNTHDVPRYAIDPALGAPLRGRRIAFMAPEQYPWPVSDDVFHATIEASRVLQSLGATVETVAVPLNFPQMTINNGNIIAAEIYHEHADAIEDPSLPFGQTLRERVLRGKQISSHLYFTTLEHRRKAIAAFRDWMRPYDMLLTPTVPFVACPLEEIDETRTGPMSFTRAFNYLDTCGISMPAGFSAEGLPIGVQLVANPWQENMVLRAAQEFQQATDWHTQIPQGLA